MDGETQNLVAELTRALETWHLSEGDHGWTARTHFMVRLLKADGSWDEVVHDWEVADRDGDSEAALWCAWVHAERGDPAGAREALERAARRGEPAAWWLLYTTHARADANRTELRSAYEQARTEHRRALEAADSVGDAKAARRVGAYLLAEAVIARQTGDQALAERQTEQGVAALRRAVDRGSAEAAALLGDRAAEEFPQHPEPDEDRHQRAQPWYQLADERGHGRSAWHCGLILAARGDTVEAEAAYRRARARGDAQAVSSLAALLARRPSDSAGAEAAHRLAADIGYAPDAHTELGAYLRERGDLTGAEGAFRRAVERSEPNAATQLRYLYRQHPHLRPKS
ncbi:hypothetical protein [Luteipulveratus mongoliensis]|uniref:Tetratricopeptide repeat protein n=1 Tax=Luteipulveratus mongoliensis TaxID=571913 RepID=A0A0K1JD51_9MICO|nr:hypothetical protein [Luteipulveratus mongoliensis]AKU14631.1 hypothetical protein VV02_00045 [Luteipulveratus mongoliensis]AKU18488.1 hypothetical protein VV02_25875 [Luteipulveratus mongoliensis]